MFAHVSLYPITVTLIAIGSENDKKVSYFTDLFWVCGD